MLQRNIKWLFNPPSGSHFGGVWERSIRTVRKILTALMKEQPLDDEGLTTHGTDYQMFRDLPTEIIGWRKPQVETLKEARKNGIQAAYSTAQPDKLYINGEFWPVGKELAVTERR